MIKITTKNYGRTRIKNCGRTIIYLNNVCIGTAKGYHYLGVMDDVSLKPRRYLKCKLTLLQFGLFALKCQKKDI